MKAASPEDEFLVGFAGVGSGRIRLSLSKPSSAIDPLSVTHLPSTPHPPLHPLILRSRPAWVCVSKDEGGAGRDG